MSLFSIDDFRRLRDEHGLALYAESVAAHRARLATLEDPEQLRAAFVEQWEAIEGNAGLDDLTRAIALKQLKEKARDTLAAARAAIAHEHAEIERVSALYYQLKREMREPIAYSW